MTGGAGFIASHIVDKLIKNGDKVVVVDNLSTVREENLNKEAIFYNVDILDDSLRKVFEIEADLTICPYSGNPIYISYHRSLEEQAPSFEKKLLSEYS